MKSWIQKALEYLKKSLGKVAVELNELDWKESLSPNNAKLCQHISAFANMPGGGFIVFGIKNDTKEVIGVSTDDATSIVDKFASLCRDGVEPLVSIDYSIEKYQDKDILIIYIKESAIKPVFLHGKTLEDSFIRSGGSSRKASRPEVGAMMLNSKSPTWEELHASKLLSEIEVITLLDFSKILELLKKPAPSDLKEIMNWLEDEKMLVNADGKGYYITNFGAITAAKDLKDFDGLVRKSIRLIKYEGKNKAGASKEFPGRKGYAIGFEALIAFIRGLLEDSEIVKNALRVDTSLYPEIALRELVANTLIHQDFTIRGTGPMVEIFDDRIVFTNPGRLLPTKKIDRLIRTTPESRNEILAAAFRRYNICEERGSGFEKAVISIELYGLPPLIFEELENSFRVTMYAPKTYAEMTNDERIEAAYQHSIISYFATGGFNNTSLRERFGMHDKQASQISLLIKDAITAGKIKPKEEENVSKKFSRYIPYWA
ncbi:ATP-binding protein [Kaistella sp.]|uniref:ATP-binding protein n=1 Tax=Kaistella sp. TaxID=2782235 RepID=UPI0035A1A651